VTTSEAGGRTRAAPRPARFRLRRGLDLPIAGAPNPASIEEGPPVGSVALLGDDAPGARLEPRVAPGDRVRTGQTLLVDRRRPSVRFTAPGAGRVRAVERAPRRRIDAVVIDLDGDEAERFDTVGAAAVPALPRERLEALMLASGLWTALRTRPFSRIPDPGSAPRAIFVTAMESEPLAPSAERIIAERGDDFALGVAALTRLTEGRVHVCTAPGAPLPLPDLDRVTRAEFDGPHPAGLPGTHIHCLEPVGPGRTVWHLGYADAIALGQLLATGRLPTERVVALAGPLVAAPRLLRTRLGAHTDDLVRGQLRRDDGRVVSGSVLAGREAVGAGAYLGRLHTQVCVLPEGGPGSGGGWIRPGARGRARRVLRGWTRRSRAAAGAFTTSLGGRRGAFYPLERLDRVVPLELLVVPLLRALLVGDADAAAQLGCLELAEEDVALLSFLCPGKLEYGALLRGVLDELEAGQA
jgi:Na+-transporting NADH:ubiquinone oxidoreductase subunit A